ncbi:hypothetical protein RPHASCH2410_CH06095 [Rhizobium phaseoli Ch24-10]|nr:hypothetical protein RPHASCH2410_CH06095 [Rhizobium phaseoli Ch24-10]
MHLRKREWWDATKGYLNRRLTEYSGFSRGRIKPKALSLSAGKSEPHQQHRTADCVKIAHIFQHQGLATEFLADYMPRQFALAF